MRGSGIETDPYLIGSVEEWNEIADLTSQGAKYIEITSDIDFENRDFKKIIISSTSTTPRYGGYLNGNAHKIKNIKDNISFAGIVEGNYQANVSCVLKDITFEKVSGFSTSSSLVLVGSFSRIENVIITGLNITTSGSFTGMRCSSLAGTKGIIKSKVDGHIQASSCSVVNGASGVTSECYSECEIYLISNTNSYGIQGSSVLLSFCKNKWNNTTANITDLSSNNILQCYSASQYNNCTGTIYPCTTSKIACFYNSDFTQGLTVVESGCVAITTEQMKDRQTFEEKGWVFTDVN